MLINTDIQEFMTHIESNAKGEKRVTSSENNKTPIQRWFPFYAGFSSSIVEEAVKFFGKENGNLVFDPFMGSGTTGVSCQKIGANVVGNEINPFLNKICQAKINSHDEIDINGLKLITSDILNKASSEWKDCNTEVENLVLTKCYPTDNLKKLITLRTLVQQHADTEYANYLFLILSKCLIPSAQVGINIPYISWDAKKTPKEVFRLFEENSDVISNDIIDFQLHSKALNATRRVFAHDSRTPNKEISSGSVNIVFTSPPYLNNFDYGEALKVFLYFWKIANNWGEINERIRKPSVVSATTHYTKRDYSLQSYEDILGKEFVDSFPLSSHELIQKAELIKKEMTKGITKRTKSFDLLTLLYFKDMFLVLKEIKRVTKKEALCFFVIGDSAPYGVHILTDNILGEMSLELGFSDFFLHPLRQRGNKWKTLTYRHKVILRESLVVIRK